MKKFYVLLVAFLSVFMLAACGGDTDPAITGVASTLTLNVGDVLNLEEGVSAIGYKNDNLTDKIKVSHTIPVDGEGKVTTSGDYRVVYRLEIDGEVVAQVIQTVTVNYVRNTSAIIDNGDFESGSVDPFTKSEFEGGAAKHSVVEDGTNKVLKVDITSCATTMAAPRIEQSGLKLDATKLYEVSFKAKADAARKVHVQLGQLLSDNPWFINIDPTSRIFDLTTSFAEYSFRFKPNTDGTPNMDDISLTFEFGKFGDDSIITACYLDDIEIKEVDSLGADTVEPTITVTGASKMYVGDEFVALDHATVIDDQDANPSLTVDASSALPEVDTDNKLTKAGNYTIVFKATDASGNTSTATWELEVAEPAGAGTELFKNNDFSDTTATDGGFTDWLVYTEEGCTLTHTISNGVVTLNVDCTASGVNYVPQFKQEGLEILAGKNYELKITLSSSVARDVLVGIQNVSWWNFHLSETVTLEAGVSQEVKLTFTGVAPSERVDFFLGLGKVGEAEAVSGAHTVTVTGLSLKETTAEVADTTAPVITYTGRNYYYVGDAFDVEALATAADAKDGTVGVTIDTTSNRPEVDGDKKLTKVGQYKVIYTAVDAAGNKETREVIVNVVERSATLMGTPSSEIATGNGAGEATSKANAQKFHVFFNDLGWDGAATQGNASYADEKLTVNVTEAGGVVWGTQVFYTTYPIAAGNYKLSFKLNSTVAGKIKVVAVSDGTSDIAVGDNNIELEFTVASESCVTIIVLGADAPLAAGTYVLSDFVISTNTPAVSDAN